MARISTEEALDLAERLSRFVLSADDIQNDDRLDEEDRQRVFGLGVLYLQQRVAEENRLKMASPQKRARRLLRTFLTDAQRAELDRSGRFVVTANGHSYRIHPNTGGVQRVMRRGSRWWIEGVFCYHEDEEDLAPGPDTAGVLRVRAIPPADRAIGILLMLLADEGRFLAEANFRPYRNRGWDSEWMTRRARIRRDARAAGLSTHDFVTGLQWIGTRDLTGLDPAARARVEEAVALVEDVA